MLNYSGLPEGLRGGTQAYVERGIYPGSFLTAVICNDLRETMMCADDTNRQCIFDIVSWFYNEAPAPCWGSLQRMSAWISARNAP